MNSQRAMKQAELKPVGLSAASSVARKPERKFCPFIFLGIISSDFTLAVSPPTNYTFKADVFYLHFNSRSLTNLHKLNVIFVIFIPLRIQLQMGLLTF